MNDVELLRILSKKARDSKTDIEMYQSYCHSIAIHFILSTEIFSSNEKLEGFLINNALFQSLLNKNNTEFRPYLYKSRTQVVGRLVRILNESEKEGLDLFLKMIRELVFHKPSSSNSNPSKEENYFDSIIEQLYRGE